MKERELFLAALEIEDPVARHAHLQLECAHDASLLARVESLLAFHQDQSQFLSTPVVQQLADDSDSATSATVLFDRGNTREDTPSNKSFNFHGPEPMTESLNDAADDIPLNYLQPSTKPGCLGRLGHYEIHEVLGRGAFGTVLKAFDEKLHRVVAIKVLAPELAATSPARKRFLREAQASAAIRHEHVVSVYAVEEAPIPYLVMEYIPGKTLEQRLNEKGPLDLPTVLRLGRQIAEGLAAAHAQDLIHRDIKPSNILLETSIEDRVKITDFGLARAADDASMTQSGIIAGTPLYMAPEQARGQKLDQRADLFSFGSVLYQMVSGRAPFRAASMLAVLKRVAEDTPRPIPEIMPETPAWLCNIISKLHAKNPDDRYQTAQEVADVLANCETQFKAHARLKDFTLIPSAPLKRRTVWRRIATPLVICVLLIVGAVVCSVDVIQKGAWNVAGLSNHASSYGVLHLRLSDTDMEFRIDDFGANLTAVSHYQAPLEPGEHFVWFQLGSRQFKTARFLIEAGAHPELSLEVTNASVRAEWNQNPIEVTELTAATVPVPQSHSAVGPWVQLFNGKDLTGWKFHPDHLGDWSVQNGILRGSFRQSHLFSERGDYRNFHLRAEVMINPGGDSGILFRAPFELSPGRTPASFGVPRCYEVEIHKNKFLSHVRPTGNVAEVPGNLPPIRLGGKLDDTLTRPNVWFMIEIMATDNHFITKVNGVETANCYDPLNKYQTGHLALQAWGQNTLVQFRKIEILELPPLPPVDTTPPLVDAPVGPD